MIYFKKFFIVYEVYIIGINYMVLYFNMIGYDGMIVLVFCMGTV